MASKQKLVLLDCLVCKACCFLPWGEHDTACMMARGAPGTLASYCKYGFHPANIRVEDAYSTFDWQDCAPKLGSVDCVQCRIAAGIDQEPA